MMCLLAAFQGEYCSVAPGLNHRVLRASPPLLGSDLDLPFALRGSSPRRTIVMVLWFGAWGGVTPHLSGICLYSICVLFVVPIAAPPKECAGPWTVAHGCRRPPRHHILAVSGVSDWRRDDQR